MGMSLEIQTSLCTEQVRTAEGSETNKTDQQADALGSYMPAKREGEREP